jgi:branched-chain amino acid transport system permease protein
MPPRLSIGHWVLLAVFAAALLLPLTGEVFYVRLATRMLIFAIIAVSLNILVGYGGMVSFGHAAFVGLGAYTAAIMTYHGVGSGYLVWPAAILVSALGALVIGALSLRTKGVYFIMITLALAQMLYYVSVGLGRYGGDDGLRMRARNSFAPLINADDPYVFLYLVAAVFLAICYATARLVASRFGRVLRGIKDNERRMQSIGYHTYRYKLAAFVIAGAMAGLGGLLNANLNAHVSPAMLHWILSGDLLIMVILGGVGTLTGPAIGAVAFVLLEEALSGLTKHWMAIFGPAMLLVVLFHRGGIRALLFPAERARG